MQLKKKSTKVFALVLSSIIISSSFSGTGNAAKLDETYNDSKENVVESVNENEDKDSKNDETLNEKDNKNLEDLSIKKLTEIRDNEIDKNLEQLKESDSTDEEIKERKDSILDPNWDLGLVGFVNGNYEDLTEKEKLIKEIDIARHINSVKGTMYPSGEYFEIMNQNYQLRNYLSKNDRSGKIVSYENMKFLIENIEDLSKYIDYDRKQLAQTLNPNNIESFSDEQVSTLNSLLDKVVTDELVNKEVRDEIKKVQDEWKTLTETSNIRFYSMAKSKISTQKILAYARKHGYTNGYYGSKNEKNNAPKPYHNFKKDGAGDCANFVSQCLHAGGYGFKTGGEYPWYYYSLNKRSAGWCHARFFKYHWMRRVGYKTVTVKDTLKFIKPGTPISIIDTEQERASHTLIATDRHSNGYNFSYAAHSDDGTRTNLLKKLKNQKITYYKANW